MPGARKRPQPCVQNEKHTSSHHGHTGNARHSPRDGFNGFLRALLGEPGFLVTIPAQCKALSRVNASVGASGPHDFAVRKATLSSVAQLASIASRTPRS
jgi:hypothetical protein